MIQLTEMTSVGGVGVGRIDEISGYMWCLTEMGVVAARRSPHRK